MVGERCVFLTAYEGPKGWTLCVDKQTGRELWRADGLALKDKHRAVNTPVSPTPVTDGLISYSASGKERWRRELEPFTNPYGMADSPMLVNDLLILQVEQDVGSYLLAVTAKDGAVRWKPMRPEANHGCWTPVVWWDQLIVSGWYQVAKLWWAEGMARQAKSTPVIDGGPERTGEVAGGQELG